MARGTRSEQEIEFSPPTKFGSANVTLLLLLFIFSTLQHKINRCLLGVSQQSLTSYNVFQGTETLVSTISTDRPFQVPRGVANFSFTLKENLCAYVIFRRRRPLSFVFPIFHIKGVYEVLYDFVAFAPFSEFEF